MRECSGEVATEWGWLVGSGHEARRCSDASRQASRGSRRGRIQHRPHGQRLRGNLQLLPSHRRDGPSPTLNRTSSSSRVVVQDLTSERAFYDKLFRANPEMEHITEGSEELYVHAFAGLESGALLDVGCGTGAHAMRLVARGYDVVAMDVSVVAVNAARQRFERAGLKGRFIVANAEHLPFRDLSFSIVWTSLLLHHFPTLGNLPNELGRVTRDRLVAFEPNAQNPLTWFAFNVVNRLIGIPAMTRNQRALWPQQLRRVFKRCGMVQLRVEYLDRGWRDRLTGARRLYQACVRWLPQRFRANKFLVAFHKQ